MVTYVFLAGIKIDDVRKGLYWKGTDGIPSSNYIVRKLVRGSQNSVVNSVLSEFNVPF